MAKTKRKKFSTGELLAWSASYGIDYNKKDMLIETVKHGISWLIIVTLTRYIWWMSALALAGGLYYGWNIIVPYIVRRKYENAAFIERNRFINNITQILMNDSKSLLEAVADVKERSTGEFKQDLTKLLTVMMSANDEENSRAFKELSDKYHHDDRFTMFLEQLETIALEGRTPGMMESLKEVKTYHNDIKMRRMDYEQAKKYAAEDMRIIILVVLIMMIAIALGFSFERYAYGFAWTLLGTIIGNLFIALNLNSYTKFFKYYYDDDIMGVSKQ